MNTETQSANRLLGKGPITLPIKYVFLDVVGFTKGRSTEAQVEIIKRLNSSVFQAVENLQLTRDKIIFLPTGDGMCIALLEISNPLDVHMQLAVHIIRLLESQNQKIADAMRRFSIRIGVNECVDTLVEDINNSGNVAGLGINIARRIMEFADAAQIIVGASVYENLRSREKYMSKFRIWGALDKHGEDLLFYQYIDSAIEGLNCDTPKAFQEESMPIVKKVLTKELAVYIALCVKHKTELIEIMKRLKVADRYFLKIMLWFMAEDYVEAKTVPEFKKPRVKTEGAGQSFLDRFKLYESNYGAAYYWVAWDLQEMISEKYLRPMWECFESHTDFLMPSVHGLSMLKSDQPLIAEDFGLMPK